MDFTGPISVEGRAEPLTADNAADFLIREQYLTFQEDEQDRVDFLDEASEATFERLTAGRPPWSPAGGRRPRPRRPPGPTHRLQRPRRRAGPHGAHRASTARCHRWRATSCRSPPRTPANNKIDMFLERALDYRAHLGPGHRARWRPRPRSSSTTGLRPRASPTSSSAAVTHRDLPLGHEPALPLPVLRPAPDRGRGRRLPLAVESQRERDRWVYSRFVEIPPGGRVTPAASTSRAPSPRTRPIGWAMRRSRLVNPDRVRLRVGRRRVG